MKLEALVVDDEVIARKVAQDMLTNLEYDVQTATTGEEGLAKFSRHHFELVVSDINMPGIDGLEMIRRMREKDPEVACVVMTVRPDQDVAVQAMRSGALGFLRKPFVLDELKDAVQTAMRERGRFQLSQKLRLELDRSRGERANFESRFIGAEKLSALGQLAPRIAHEIKSSLQAVCGNSELALHWLQNESGEAADAVRSHLEAVLPAAARIETLVNQMFELGKPSDSGIEEVDLRHELIRILDGFRSMGAIGKCDIEEEYEPDLPFIYGDPSQLEQVFRNLIINASHAVEDQPRKVVRVSVAAGEAGMVQVKVADSGCGISPETLARIFQPFFTTKVEGKGTGLGLAIVKTVVERHGGTVEVTSEIGKGTSFTVALPIEERANGATR